MPRNRRKRSAGSVDCEVLEFVPPGSVDFLSVDMLGGKVIKKRAIERLPPNISVPFDDSPPHVDDTEHATPTTPSPKGPSRSVSVSVFLNSALTVSDCEPADRDAGNARSAKNVPR